MGRYFNKSRTDGLEGHVLQGQPPVPLTLRRSGRARRITLRISGLDGRVTVTLPNAVSVKEALAFVEEKADWIRSHLSKRTETVQVGLGTDLPLDGVPRRIVPGKGRGVKLGAQELAVPGPADLVGAKVQAWVKARARDRMADLSDGYAQKLGRGYSGLSLRDTRSRWGSCTSAGRLMYSWRLILAPCEVQAYVAAHEVAHLQEMNHSSAFWQLVEDLNGPYQEWRGWLRQNGAGLHAYRFDD